MKIIHISDLHYPDKKINTKALVNHILSHYNASPVKPIIVLSGDILHSSFEKKNYLEARNILKNLQNENYKILICPGNHDLKVLGVGHIIFGRKRFNSYFKSFLPSDKNYYGVEDNDLIDFPIVHKFENHFFIGLDSLAVDSGLLANGNLGEHQLNELEKLLLDIKTNHNNPIIIIYLHHSPFKYDYNYDSMKLKDNERFLELISGIDILLFGHFHDNIRYSDEELKYNINCIHLSGGSTHGENIDWTEIETETNITTTIKYKIS